MDTAIKSQRVGIYDAMVKSIPDHNLGTFFKYVMKKIHPDNEIIYYSPPKTSLEQVVSLNNFSAIIIKNHIQIVLSLFGLWYTYEFNDYGISTIQSSLNDIEQILFSYLPPETKEKNILGSIQLNTFND